MSSFAFISLFSGSLASGEMTPFMAMLIPLLGVIAYPWLARRFFSLYRLTEGQRRSLLRSLPQGNEAFVNRLRVWDTGETICNAAVVGCVPGFSFVLVSDALLTRLSPRSVAAIVAHEIGHLKLCHVPMRLVIVFAGGTLGLALVRQAETLAAWQNVAHVAAMFATAGYMGLMLHLVAPLLEYHADAYAIDTLSKKNGNRRRNIRELSKALAELTLLSGIRPDKKTWLYPSFEERRQAMLCQQTSPSFRHRLEWMLGIVLLSQLVLITIGVLMIAS